MKLSNDSIEIISDALSLLCAVKIDRLMIDQGFMSGIDENQTLVMFSENRVPDLYGYRLGLRRLSVLKSYIELTQSEKSFIVELMSADDESMEVSSLVLSSITSMSEFRAASYERLNSPKGIIDEPVFKIRFYSDRLKTVIQASTAVKSDTITLKVTQEDNVTFGFIDDGSRDTLVINLDAKIEYLSGKYTATDICYHYFLKSTIPLLKKALSFGGVCEIVLCEKGMAKLYLNGFCFILIPKYPAIK